MRSAKFGISRRVGYYNAPLLQFSGVSLRVVGGCAAYTDAMYEIVFVMVAELLTAARRSKRFSRSRATLRVMHHIASTAVYGGKLVSEQDLQPVSERGSSKTDAVKENIKRCWMRHKEEWQKHKRKRCVVFFGKGTFGRSRRGRCRRKNLLWSTGLLVPVVLTNKYNTPTRL